MPTVIIHPARGTASRATLRTHEVAPVEGLIRHRDSTWWNEHEARGDWSAWRPFVGVLHHVDVVTTRWGGEPVTETHGPFLTKRDAEKARNRIARKRCGIRSTVTVREGLAASGSV